MYLAFLASVVAFFWAAAAGWVLGAVAAYVCAGLAWRSYELQKSPLYRPVLANSFKGILIWPVRSSIAAFEYFQGLRDPQRFAVVYGEVNTARFASWDEAVTFARKQAAESGREDIAVFDHAKFKKGRFTGEVGPVMYWVLPSGEIKRAN